MTPRAVLELLALGAVLGGRKDLLADLAGMVRTEKAKSLVEAMALASDGKTDALYEWFRSEAHVKLDRKREKIADAIVAELVETGRLLKDADDGMKTYSEAAKKLMERRGA